MNQRMRDYRLLFLLGICIAAPAKSTVFAPPIQAQREQWQKVDAIFSALDVEEGDTIADIGAGDGFFTVRLAPLVGSTGTVLAVDVDAAALGRLERNARRSLLTNVRTITNDVDDPRLQPNSLDGALIVISYHDFTEHEAMLAGIKRALKRDARLVIVDNVAWDRSRSRRTQTQRHHIDIELVADDLESAGFEILERVPAFIDEDYAGRRRRQWMLVATPT